MRLLMALLFTIAHRKSPFDLAESYAATRVPLRAK
jgi:hypothetical protein